MSGFALHSRPPSRTEAGAKVEVDHSATRFRASICPPKNANCHRQYNC